MSLTTFDRHVCLADVAVANIKRVSRTFEGTSCTTKKSQNIESVLRLPKNAKTIVTLLADDRSGYIIQLCYRVPTIRVRRI